MTIEFVPRWLWQEIKVPQSGEVILDASNFANTTPYPMRLHWISITGNVALAGAPYDNASGGVMRRLNVELGITGYSDINLVPFVGTAYFAARHHIQKDYLPANGVSPCANMFIPRAIRVPQDGGLVVEVENIEDRSADLTLYKPSIIAHGYKDESRIPGFLAGRLNENITNDGGKKVIDATDLLNKGREDFIITDISLDTKCSNKIDETTTQYSQMTNVAWRVNPLSGIQWMPNPNPIPVGNICPFTRQYDQADEGPQVYDVPENTVLQPRQRLSIKLTEVSAAAQSINVCIHGELEVE